MIRTENEYKRSLEQIEKLEQQHRRQREKLAQKGLSPAAAQSATAAVLLMVDEIKQEVAQYERLRRGDLQEVVRFGEVGRMLIALRIARNLSQRELAERLGVHESQVSRDERHEYAGITVERAGRILDAIGADVRLQVELAGGSSIPPAAQG